MRIKSLNQLIQNYGAEYIIVRYKKTILRNIYKLICKYFFICTFMNVILNWYSGEFFALHNQQTGT